MGRLGHGGRGITWADRTARTVVHTVVQDREYSVTDRGDYLYITLRDKARPNSELLVAPIAQPQDSKVRDTGWRGGMGFGVV